MCVAKKIKVKNKKPTAAQMEQLSEITDALQYSCGAPLIPEDLELSGVFVVRQDVSCADPVDKLYYSSRKFEEICCWCGPLEPEARINNRLLLRVEDTVH